MPIERSWMAVGLIVEIQVPFDRIGAAPGSDLQFAIQVRDRSDAVLEAVPHGRYWTVAIPQVGVDHGGLASVLGHPPVGFQSNHPQTIHRPLSLAISLESDNTCYVNLNRTAHGIRSTSRIRCRFRSARRTCSTAFFSSLNDLFERGNHFVLAGVPLVELQAQVEGLASAAGTQRRTTSAVRLSASRLPCGAVRGSRPGW